MIDLCLFVLGGKAAHMKGFSLQAITCASLVLESDGLGTHRKGQDDKPLPLQHSKFQYKINSRLKWQLWQYKRAYTCCPDNEGSKRGERLYLCVPLLPPTYRVRRVKLNHYWGVKQSCLCSYNLQEADVRALNSQRALNPKCGIHLKVKYVIFSILKYFYANA